MNKDNIKKYFTSAIVIVVAVGIIFFNFTGINPIKTVMEEVDDVVNDTDTTGDGSDIVDYYMKLSPQDLSYNNPPPHTYDPNNKPKEYIQTNLYYGESEQMKRFEEDIDKQVNEQVSKHDMGDWAYEGIDVRRGIYNKNNVLQVTKTFLSRHYMTEFTITDMRMLDKFDEMEEQYFIFGDRASLEKIVSSGMNKEVYHNSFSGTETKESGKADIRVLIVDMKLVCKSPWPVMPCVIPQLCYLDEQEDYLEPALIVYDNNTFPENVCYFKPVMYSQGFNRYLLGKDEEVNITVGFIIDVSMDNAYLIFDDGCQKNQSYFSCDQHIVKVL